MHIKEIAIDFQGGKTALYIKAPELYSEKKQSKALALFLFCALCGLISLSGTDEEPVLSYGIASKLIVVDPGHGGFDPGAWRGNLLEKDITLQISKKLQAYLSGGGAVVVLLRENDEDLAPKPFKGSVRERKRADLAARVQAANKSGADIYISIHANADVSPRWSGAQTFYNGKSEASKILAEAIQDELTRVLGNTKRKAKTGNYYIIDKTEMPAVIAEVGFISNPAEARLLTDSSYQDRVAYAIFSGIIKSQSKEIPEKETWARVKELSK